MNKVILCGRIVRDPELRTSEVGDNSSFCRFSIAVDRPWVRDRENQQTADFISCVCFGKTAEFIEKWFHKGDPIMVEGRIQTGSYTNRDGQKVYTTDVNVERTEFVPKSNGTGETKPDVPVGSRGGRDTSEARRHETYRDVPGGVNEELPFS